MLPRFIFSFTYQLFRGMVMYNIPYICQPQ